MIYVTGDTHGDKTRLKRKNLKKIKKGDYLIICGDFGFVWKGDRSEKRFLKRLGKRKYSILFVDGAHENFNELEKYPAEEWNGGKTRHISGNLRNLMRGEVFNLGEDVIFAFGGGHLDEPSADYEYSGAPELPTEEDFKKGLAKLEKLGSVDYIFSYEAPSRITEFLRLSKTDFGHLNTFLDILSERCEFKKWFFGQHHINKTVSSKYQAVYDRVIKADKEPNINQNKKIKNKSKVIKHKTERKQTNGGNQV